MLDDITRERIQTEVDANDVLLFMKGTPVFPQCGFSAAVIQVLSHLQVKFSSINVLEDPDIRDGIKQYSDWPTIPQLYVKGEFVSHGHVSVNGRRVTIPSFMCKEGDVIEVREKSREIPMVLEAVASNERDIPDYVEVDAAKMKGTFLRQPKLEDIPYPVKMEPNFVIEFYSKN